MPLARSKKKWAIIDKLIAMIEEKQTTEQRSLIVEFVRQFYGTVALEDLQKHNLSDLYGAALSFWDFLSKRKPGELKIRAYNPDFATNAWQSTHTILEILYDDMPFLVDSLFMEINRLDMTSHLIVHYGGMKVRRDKTGKIKAVLGQEDDVTQDIVLEAPIYVELDRQTDPAVLKNLIDNVKRVFSDVTIAVEDWKAMRQKVLDAIDGLQERKKNLDDVELAETIDFLRWITDNHFTFLGYRDYELVKEGDDQVLRIIPNTGLGVLRDTSTSQVSRSLAEMTPEARSLTLSNQILIISKTNTRSTIHRPIYTDYIGIKRFDDKGHVIGERRIIGLYTSAAYNTNPAHIPFLRRKVALIMQKAKLNERSHTGKVLLNILETLPRDDLFQTGADELLDIAMGIFHLQERRRIRLFMRKDIYGRFVSCLVYVPRDRFNTELRIEMQDYLLKAFHSNEIYFSTRFSDSVLARIHFVLRIDPKNPVDYDVKEIEQHLIEIGRDWRDDFSSALLDVFGEEKGNELYRVYGKAFPSSYREIVPVLTAVHDVKHIEKISSENSLEMSFYNPVDRIDGELRFKVYRADCTIPLSDVLPILENMGLRVISERPFKVQCRDGRLCWINDFGMTYCGDTELDIEAIKGKFQDAFANIWFERAENDGFNQLVLGSGLNWREISVLRAYAKFFRQTGFTFSQVYIEQTLSRYPVLAKQLVRLFKLRFEPKRSEKSRQQMSNLEARIEEGLESVISLDDDRIIRRYFAVICATLRTNYFQTGADGQYAPYLAFKLNPKAIPELPLPRPMFEIFVYSPRFEGVHLRGGKVARGGLRWSDRPEDFRTEILGLMKAQQVKNAVIVPSGAKGGFVPKHLPVDQGREAILEEGIACYKQFITALLSLTDNQKSGDIIPPKDVLCYDDPDPYLVVAADKGTATFSDIANAISLEHDFWLGDAFASGGSTGYDHKKMGITARGAWESVKRHFRELGKDIQTEPFTCISIGDMAGDVFGNGMLLSSATKLVAAFNHMHIFVDPDPDPAVSFKERQRLFNLPRSMWTDYNEKLISKGGGIFERSAKSVKISKEMQRVFDIDQDIVTPNELLRSLLKAPVDLIWNGGIGTFVKGKSETDAEVGDRSNDAIRITADELRCQVVGEGGNLGFTQSARVEYALRGGLIYTDFIDNSGGVDCSDHEVNIKILLNDIVRNGDMTEKQRNTLLATMTDEVGELVLKNNYRQTQAISLAAMQAPRNLELHRRYINELERLGKLDRSLEFLPTEEALSERKLAGQGLTRPGIAVLLAYSKISLKGAILASDVPEDYYLCNMLERAFPQPLRKKFRKEMESHSLKREIIATQLSNDMVNEMGFSFIYRTYDETGAPISAIVRAYTIVKKIFNLEHIWELIEALDNHVSAQAQVAMMMSMIRLIRRSTRWFLKNKRMHLDIEQTISDFLPGLTVLKQHIPGVIIGDDRTAYNHLFQEYKDMGVGDELAKELASTRILLSALDIVEAANTHGCSVEDVANVYFAIGDVLHLGWTRGKVIAQQVDNHWDALSREALRDDLDWQQRLLTIAILDHPCTEDTLQGRLAAWLGKYEQLVSRWQTMLAELRAGGSISFTMFFVAIRELLDLTQTSMQSMTTEQGKKMDKKTLSGTKTCQKPLTPKNKSA